MNTNSNVIVVGRMEVEPDRRDEFIADARDGMRSAQAEAGCLDYVFSADPLEDGVIRLFERWESKEALAAHLAGQASRKDSAPRVPVIKAKVVQYEVVNEGRVGS